MCITLAVWVAIELSKSECAFKKQSRTLPAGKKNRKVSYFVQNLCPWTPCACESNNFCDDSRIKWDWMKYKIRGESISYSKLKAKERRNRIQTIENRLKICEEKIAESPTQENLANLESVKTEYEQEYDYIVRGSIIRSRATWFEQGERNNKYFLNLENRNKKKSCIRKLIRANGEETTVPDTIMTEIHSFYSELYMDRIRTFVSCLTEHAT